MEKLRNPFFGALVSVAGVVGVSACAGAEIDAQRVAEPVIVHSDNWGDVSCDSYLKIPAKAGQTAAEAAENYAAIQPMDISRSLTEFGKQSIEQATPIDDADARLLADAEIILPINCNTLASD